jgi:hypothetical protein
MKPSLDIIKEREKINFNTYVCLKVKLMGVKIGQLFNGTRASIKQKDHDGPEVANPRSITGK